MTKELRICNLSVILKKQHVVSARTIPNADCKIKDFAQIFRRASFIFPSLNTPFKISHARMSCLCLTHKKINGRPLIRYLIPAILVAIAIILDVIFKTYFRSSVFFLPLAATAFTALICGFGPGVVATLLSVIGLEAFLLEPGGSFLHISRASDAVRILLFVPSGLILVWLSGSLKKTKESAERTNTNLRDEKALREKFVSTLTHDLRNPLSAAKLSLDHSLRIHEISDPMKKSLRSASAALTRADKMIQDLLDVNRIRAGHEIPLNLESFDLVRLVRETAGNLTTLFGQRFDFSPEVPTCFGKWDRAGVTRIIDNLAGNAIKYGSKNSRITIALRADDTRAFLSVHNLGRAIPANELPELFGLYHRANSAEQGSSGWGIGLSLVKSMAEIHGGKVSVRSSEAEGTTFTVELPLVGPKKLAAISKKSA